MSKKTPLKGKTYSDYLKDDDARNGAKRRALMEAAKKARRERKKKGIKIDLPKMEYGKSI